jgi:hypothetical protein
LRIVIGRENADLGGNGDVVTDAYPSSVIEPTPLIDNTVIAHNKVTAGIKPGAHEDVAVLSYLKSHNTAIEQQPNPMRGNVGDDMISYIEDGLGGNIS